MLEYRAGSTNSVADDLSRRAELDQVALMAMNAIVRADSRVAINIGTKIRKALTRDPVAQQLLKLIERESDGQTERFNSMLEEYLRHFVNAIQKNWVKLLNVAQLCFNSRKSSSTGKSAFEIMNGQQPLLPHTINVPNAGKSPRAISFSEEWRQNIDLAHSYLEKAARRMKKHADKNMRSQEFNVGDKVMRPNQGPGLKPKTTGKRVAEAILNDRVITASRKRHQEYLVKWQGYMDEENTWERASDLSAYTDKIEAYHIQKLTRASTTLVGENVMGCPLQPPSTAPLRPSCTAPPCPSNTRPCALASSSSLAPMRPSSTAPARLTAVPVHAKSQP
ncbi:hypothetical protein RJ640_012422 [Escallonia rubra]|uniref:Chromo domain-containing protein n=1 Tax=Escallonia rubra TaxID=112253 RepID=A0AA88U1X5_9ASTE|nr:hypothetical protein RJ640_012422 [Escallonia rubra]